LSESQSFFTELKALQSFSESLDWNVYKEIPPDWSVILCDVKNSTNAIEEGRYKNVNFAGAACITAVLNKVPHKIVPYVFGGDGASILVPEEYCAVLASALRSTQQFVRDTFALDLRIFICPYENVRAQDQRIYVAKLQKGPNCFQALLRGEGISAIEKRAKAHSELFFVETRAGQSEVTESEQSKAPLEGLSCRWQPLQNQHGAILSIIMLARGAHEEKEAIFRKVFKDLHKILPDLEARSPVQEKNLKYATVPEGWKLEWRRDASALPALIFLMGYLLKIVFLKLCFRLRRGFGLFDVPKYMKETREQNDFVKVEEGFKMVLDCSLEESERIEALLARYFDEGSLFYGLHRASSAIMTCLVFSAAEGEHVHFLDGTDGGYTAAAKKMKEQIKHA
jgi:hypothetical protein